MAVDRLTIACLLCVICAGSASASEPEESYELRRLRRAIETRGFRVEPEPEGKRIAFIELVREDVLAEDEVWPTWPNMFHWLTRPNVVRRELLLETGDVYNGDRIEESMRNLRALAIFALVHIEPVVGPEPGTVGLLVYTRDLWSLRLETDFAGAGSAFSGVLQLTERNLFGRNKALSVRAAIAPKTFTFGQAYRDVRLFGRKLSLTQSLDAIFNRASGQPEGSVGAVQVARPFYNLAQRVSWAASASYRVFVHRELADGEITSVQASPEGGVEPCTGARGDCIRQVWDERSYSFDVYAIHRSGERYKQSFFIGAGASGLEVAANEETQLDPDDEEVFEQDVLPRERRQIYPYVGYGLNLPRFVNFENLATFGQTEAVQVGPSVGMTLAFPLRAFGSSVDAMTVSASGGYTVGGGDALAELALAGSARLEDGSVIDQQVDMLARGATPPWLLGRLVWRGSWLAQRRDSSNARIALGADNGLRGFRAGEFGVNGGSRLLSNLEHRSLPIEIFTVHLGSVLFYDAGGVYQRLSDLTVHHSLGVGLRALFPQFNRYVFRADFGVPLDGESFRVLFSFGSSQAVFLTDAEEG